MEIPCIARGEEREEKGRVGRGRAKERGEGGERRVESGRAKERGERGGTREKEDENNREKKNEEKEKKRPLMRWMKDASISEVRDEAPPPPERVS